MNDYFVTFGQRYRDEEHPKFEDAHPDGWVRVVAEDETAAREAAWMKFDQDYSMLYNEESFKPDSFPRGELGVIREVMLPGGHLAWLLDADLARVQAEAPTAEIVDIELLVEGVPAVARSFLEGS